MKSPSQQIDELPSVGNLLSYAHRRDGYALVIGLACSASIPLHNHKTSLQRVLEHVG